MLRKGLIHVTWTTNFDPLIENAFAQIAGEVSSLSIFAIENAKGADARIKNGKHPILIKLHGDFRSVNLENIDKELQNQEYSLQHCIQHTCQNKGLVVVGYSGRDQSVISALNEALQERNPYPNGLFWLERSAGQPLKHVEELLSEARSKGVEAHLVRIDGFEELMQDIARLIPDAEDGLEQYNRLDTRVWTAPPKPVGRQGWPVIRKRPVRPIGTGC